MADPLAGTRTKLDRAREHVEALDAETRAFVDAHPYRVVRKYYAKTCHATFRFVQDTPPPLLRWGVLLGDAIHEFSSALDHIAWQFALKTRSNPARSTAFPVCLRDGDWESKRTKDMLKHIGLDDRAFIRDKQPYPAPNGHEPRTHALAMLRLLSRIDKHQVLNTAVLMPLDTDITVINIDRLSSVKAVRGIRLYDEPMQDKAKFARVLLAEPCPEMDMNVELALYVALFGPEYGHMHRGSVFMVLNVFLKQIGILID